MRLVRKSYGIVGDDWDWALRAAGHSRNAGDGDSQEGDDSCELHVCGGWGLTGSLIGRLLRVCFDVWKLRCCDDEEKT